MGDDRRLDQELYSVLCDERLDSAYAFFVFQNVFGLDVVEEIASNGSCTGLFANSSCSFSSLCPALSAIVVLQNKTAWAFTFSRLFANLTHKDENISPQSTRVSVTTWLFATKMASNDRYIHCILEILEELLET